MSRHLPQSRDASLLQQQNPQASKVIKSKGLRKVSLHKQKGKVKDQKSLQHPRKRKLHLTGNTGSPT